MNMTITALPKYVPIVARCSTVLDSLNAQYGRGEISSVRLSMSGHGEFTQTIWGASHGRKLSFRIRHGNGRLTVYALRHQATVSL